MINWEYYNVKIDNSARLQFEHYFNDIKLILDKQNLVFKENEVFSDLEDHIIDYIRNHNITNISFKEAMQIITELGPPDEYTDFSNMPSLIDEINKSKVKSIKSNIVSSRDQVNDLILCQSCNAKNDRSSVYCIQCGQNLQKDANTKIDNKPLSLSSISLVINRNPEYFFSLLTFYLLGFTGFLLVVLNSQNSEIIINIFNQLFFTNELIIVPILFIVHIRSIDYTRYDLTAFLSTYVVKILTFIFLSIIAIIVFNQETSIFSLLFTIILFLIPVILTKILFFTSLVDKNPTYFKQGIKPFSKIIYICFFGFLVFIALYTIIFNNGVFNFVSGYDGFIILLFAFVIIDIFADQFSSPTHSTS